MKITNDVCVTSGMMAAGIAILAFCVKALVLKSSASKGGA